MLRCNAEILLRNVVAMGLADAAPGGFWAASATGARAAKIARCESFISNLWEAKDSYSGRGLRFTQSIRAHYPVQTFHRPVLSNCRGRLPPTTCSGAPMSHLIRICAGR